MPVDFYCFSRDDNPSNREGWLRTVDMLGAFSDRYGLYPFADEKYGIYQFTFPGGMEHQTMTGQGGFGESLSAHELAHQWWGDMVTCATWHDIWLNEGFATYSEVLWAEARAGADGHDTLVRTMQLYRPRKASGSVYVYQLGSVDRIFDGDLTYAKGAWVLHMLRRLVGDRTFFEILAGYRAAFAYGSATTEDFRAIAEGISGRELGWFFEQWVYGTTVPSYRWAWRPVSAGGKDFAEIFVQQGGSSSQPAFRTPLDLRIWTPDMKSTTVTVTNDFRGQSFLVETDGVPQSVEFDPEGWILWSAVTSTSFVSGPARIVAVDPAPGSRRKVGDASPIRVAWVGDLRFDASAISLRGDRSGRISISAELDAAARIVTIRPALPLPEDGYTLTIADSMTDSAGHPIDGEIPGRAPYFPSGNGVAGGEATIRFGVSDRVTDVPPTETEAR